MLGSEQGRPWRQGSVPVSRALLKAVAATVRPQPGPQAPQRPHTAPTTPAPWPLGFPNPQPSLRWGKEPAGVEASSVAAAAGRQLLTPSPGQVRLVTLGRGQQLLRADHFIQGILCSPAGARGPRLSRALTAMIEVESLGKAASRRAGGQPGGWRAGTGVPGMGTAEQRFQGGEAWPGRDLGLRAGGQAPVRTLAPGRAGGARGWVST